MKIIESEKIIESISRMVPCKSMIVIAGRDCEWTVHAKSGSPVASFSEFSIRAICSYGNVVVASPENDIGKAAGMVTGSGSIVCVSINSRDNVLCGALLISTYSDKFKLSAAQFYALQTQVLQLGEVFSLQTEFSGAEKTSVIERLRLLESVVMNAKDAIVITEAEPISEPGPRIVYCNPSFENTTGYSKDEVVGLTPRILQCEDTSRESLNIIRESLKKWRPVEVELLNQRKDGSRFWVELSIVPVANNEGLYTHWVSVQRDISARKDLEQISEMARVERSANLELEARLQEREIISEKLSYMAFHDDLTSLKNRAFLKNAISDMVDSNDGSASDGFLLYLDLDGFKLVNDSLGHHAGDTLLQIVAERLKGCVRSGDILARLGGDEFAVLMKSNVTADLAVGLADRIVNQLQQPMDVEGHEVSISCSVGIVMDSFDHREPDDIIQDADAAMYAAKREGKGRWKIFESSMRKLSVTTLIIQSSLRQAIARGEFELHYQPIVCSRTGFCESVEALLRWNSKALGTISPDVFIPIAEEMGLIHEIGSWVMTNACRDFLKIKNIANKEVSRVSVNVSGREINKKGYVEKLKEIINTVGIYPNQIQIEITESVLVKHPRQSEVVLSEIRRMGIKVSLDDFGTGYSSLSYIENYSIDNIKIDKSFVSRVQHGRSEAVIKSILMLAQSLELCVTAEGVENSDQLEVLKEIGCDSIQGYLFSRPLSFGDLISYLADT